MKRIIAMASAFAIICVLSACGEAKDGAPESFSLENYAAESESADMPQKSAAKNVLWPKSEYTESIPEPSFGKLESAASVDGGGFAAEVSEASYKDAKEYAELCKKEGFIAEPYESDHADSDIYTYAAKNSAGFRVDVMYSAKLVHISVVKC